MWSQILLCLLVGLAYASNNPGWKDNSEYVYQVYGRTLASLNQISDDYSGIVLKAKLTVRPRSDGNLDGQISEPQYAQIHAQLEDGWDQEIPDSKLSFQELPLSSRPFQIVMNEGAIRDLIVDREISNWEANVFKSIVSQLQLDTNAKNLIPSHINVLAQEKSNTAVYKTMEETVTGVSETEYDIHLLPEYVLQTSPWLVPLKNLRGDGEIIEIVKNKNFTHSTQRPSYHFGLGGVKGYEFANKIGDFASRTSVSRAVLSGNLNRFTIQNSVTVDQIVLSPTMDNKQKGSVNTMLNITLLSVLQQSQQWEQPSNPVNTGLVYRYNEPYETSNGVRAGEEYDHKNYESSAESYSLYLGRSKRDIDGSRNILRRTGSNYPEPLSDYEEESWHQPQPKLNEAPPSPLLPFNVGYNGQSIKLKDNIVETTRKLAQKIGSEIKRPEEIPNKNTIGKSLILTSLVRTMDSNEIQQVAGVLYSNEQHGPQSAAWKVYRDAVAQAGTGPALVTIKDWIKTNKISNKTAAEVVGTAAYSARQPTEEYMKAFFAMVQNEDIMSQSYLNESVLLSYTNLVFEVYSNEQVAHKKYPVHSFGPFRTKQGLDYVKSVVIPYLTQMLHEAISDDDTQLIHAYIRALGNVGHQRILEAFEPYLEGQKQASHFQRVLMVVALDKLAKSNPRVARSVLYKIYQNPSEQEQVRVAAVGQLMRTNPPPSMLQRMASYTNLDPNNYVNSVVKSAIESASQLEGNGLAELRSAAQSAKHLLTSEEYGDQYSYQKLRSYVVEQMRLTYTQSVQSFASPDNILPKGIKYILQSSVGGIKQYLVNVQAMVSSVDDLISVFQQQTEEYKKQQQEKQSHNPTQNHWSSEYIAQLLNLDYEQREQLEGNVYFHMGQFQKIWSFDNQTFENLPKMVKELEEQLRNGQHYDYSKMYSAHEIAISFPTALGLPFIYTYDRPIFVHYEASIKVSANPSLSSGQYLREPDTVESEFEIRAFVSGRAQSQFGFITPFDSQRYSAGYDKNFQIVVPLAGRIQLDLQKNQLKAEFQNANSGQNTNLLHYSSWPYTAKNDIYNPEPEHQVIRKKYPHRINTVLGEKSTGIALNWEISSDERIDVPSIYKNLQQQDFVSSILSPWVNENIQYVEANVVVNSEKSFTQKVAVQLGYQQEYQSSSSPQQGSDQDFPDDPLKRQKEFIKRAGGGIKSAHVHVADATFVFQGQQQIKYTATVGGSKSNVDPKGRILFLFRKGEKQSQPLRFYLSADTYFTNTNGLNLNYAMQMDVKSKANIEAILTGPEQTKPSKINARIEFSKSEGRKQYLSEQPEYQECLHQMQEGNYQLPVCAKMTAKANLLDKFVIKTVSEDIDPRIVNYTYKFYSALRHQLYPSLEENIVDVQPSESQSLDIEGQFHPDLQAVNFSIISSHGKVEARNVRLSKWVRDLVVPHPVFHVGSRLSALVYKYDTYRPICVVDKTAASTFDNRTYPLNLADDWTVLLQYVPRRPLSNERRRPRSNPLPEQDVESYVVLVRDSDNHSSQKELKMVMQTPGTDGKIVEIQMKPHGPSQLPRVFLNNEEIKYDQQEAYDIYGGYIQVYALPNNEVKLEIFKAYYVIYDGERVKLTAVNNKFRDAARGLCGTFTGEPETDFASPGDCILQTPEDFVASYTIAPSGKKMKRSDQEECYQKNVVFANYISSKDAGREGAIDVIRPASSGVNTCSKLQTHYLVQGDETCFTINALPTCKQGCRQGPSTSKNVPVHCLQSNSVTQLWKNEINKGASPDFSRKSQSRIVRMMVPQSCLP